MQAKKPNLPETPTAPTGKKKGLFKMKQKAPRFMQPTTMSLKKDNRESRIQNQSKQFSSRYLKAGQGISNY